MVRKRANLKRDCSPSWEFRVRVNWNLGQLLNPGASELNGGVYGWLGENREVVLGGGVSGCPDAWARAAVFQPQNAVDKQAMAAVANDGNSKNSFSPGDL